MMNKDTIQRSARSSAASKRQSVGVRVRLAASRGRCARSANASPKYGMSANTAHFSAVYTGFRRGGGAHG